MKKKSSIAFLSVVVLVAAEANVGVACAQVFDFKGIVLGGKNIVAALQEKHRVKCDVEHRTEYGVTCVGNETMLGSEGFLTVQIDNAEIVRGILFTYNPNDAKQKLQRYEMEREVQTALIEKFGRPTQRVGMSLTWANKQGQVVE